MDTTLCWEREYGFGQGCSSTAFLDIAKQALVSIVGWAMIGDNNRQVELEPGFWRRFFAFSTRFRGCESKSRALLSSSE